MNKRYVSIILFLSLHIADATRQTITRSGLYSLGEDITYNPTSANDPVILIDANEVTLDLAGRYIRQQSGNTQSGINGIEIAANRSKVTIQNGIIENMTGKGILVNAGCSTIALDSITTTSCNVRGFSFEGTALNPILGFSANNCTASSCCQGATGDYGIFVGQSIGFQFSTGSVSGNGAITHNVSGIRIENSSQGRLTNVSASGNFGTTEVKGFDISNLNQCLLESCFSGANQAFALNATCVGYDLANTSSVVVFENCGAFVNSALIFGSDVFGFRIDSSTNDCSFEECRVINHSAAHNMVGFSFTSNARNFIESCIISRNTALTGTAVGIQLTNCTGHQIFNCAIDEQNSVASTSSGVDVTSCIECIMQKCEIGRNIGNNNANSFGIRLSPQATGANVFTENICNKNGTNLLNQFVGFSGSQQSVVNNQNVNSIAQPFTNLGFH